MDKRIEAINFLMSHKDLAILLVSRLYPLDKKYKHKLEKKETETKNRDQEEGGDSGSEGRWDEDDNLHEHGCACSECEQIKTVDQEKEYSMTPTDHHYESSQYFKDTKNDWVYLGPWQEDMERLMKKFNIKPYEGVGNEIWKKVFKPVLDDRLVEEILKNG